MRLLLVCLAIASLTPPLPLSAMSQKPEVTVRFHTEASPNDSEAFSIPVNLIYQRKQVYLSRIPDFSEKQIDRILPFPAKDGSWGCVFKLSPQGRIRLETMSGEIRGAALVIFIGSKAGGIRQVSDMIIDRPVSDGVITVARGLTEIEILALKKQFKTIGEQEKKGWREKPRNPVEQLPGAPVRPQSKPSLLEPLSTSAPPRRRGNSEPDLPRLAD